MRRDYYLSLARAGLRMPIGTDLVLHEQPDPEAVALDGRALGRVVETAARRYGTPLAVPLMDLRLEKADLEHGGGSPAAPFPPRSRAHIDSIRYIASETDLVAVGMAIGPFSLMTKLMADPITAVAMAGLGVSAEDDPAVAEAERCLEAAEFAVHRSVGAQIEAGARAVIICEPAANRVYISPKQLERGSDVFERFVMQPNLRLRALLEAGGADLIFHDCGELTDSMVHEFATRLDPVILSLGSSRKLWEDARLVPKPVVLYGNLPTKSFYSDDAMPLCEVVRLASDLAARMCAAEHPHILGSECDVLHVPESGATIRAKVEAMLRSR
jgi:uroporphyrinogen-III decarboxylase